MLEGEITVEQSRHGERDYPVALTDQASHRVLVMDPAAPDWNDEQAIVWSWAPDEDNGFAGLTYAWGLPTDAKVRVCRAWGGRWMVVTDSLGLAAIVPYPAGDSRRWGMNVGGNPHSAELLPGGNIAVAASTAGWVRVYASSQGSDAGHYAEFVLPGAHGVEWDADRELLWALGTDDLVALRIAGTDAIPVVEEVDRIALPTRGGHDLQPVAGDPDRLWVSTGREVYQFVKSVRRFDPAYPGCLEISRAAVKSVGNQPSGQVAQTVPQPGSLYEWTTDTVDLFGPRGLRIREGAAIYKARILLAERSEPRLWAIGTSYRLEDAGRFEEQLPDMARDGIRYLELAWRPEKFDLFDPAKERFCESLIGKAKSLGMNIWTMHLPYGPQWDPSNLDASQRDEAVQRHLRLLCLARRWNIRTAVLHPSWEPIPDAERPARLQACKMALAALAEEAARLNVRIAVECLPRTCLGNTSEEMAQLMEASGLLGICCDVNHLVQEPPEAFIRKLGSRIVTVHLSDNDGIDEAHWLPGQGVIRWDAVAGALADAGYRGPAMFEVRNAAFAALRPCWQELLG